MAKAFIKRMTVVYGAPDTDDVPAFLGEYIRQLKTYSDDVLDAALDRMLRTRRYKSWPTIADCLSAVHDVLALRGAAASSPPPKEVTFKKLAEDILSEPIAVQAARDGWILGLYDYVSKHGSKPSISTIHELKDNAKFVDRCAAGAVDMGVAHGALLKLANSLLERREKLAKRVLGEDAA